MTLSKALGQIGLQEGAIAFTCANPVPEIYPFEVKEAVDVAAQAIRDGVVKRPMDPEAFSQQALRDIQNNRGAVQMLMEREKIKTPPKSMIDEAVLETVREIRGDASSGGVAW